MKERYNQVLQGNMDSNVQEDLLQRVALEHPYLRQLIGGYLEDLERRIGPANIVDVVFSV